MIDNVMKRYVIRVMVVDDHDLVRKGLVGLLEGRGIKVVGEARLGVDAVRLASELEPDVVLMDLNMPGMSGVEATQRLSASAPHARVVVLTVFDDDGHVMDAIRAGACGYLLKEAPPDQIAEAVRAAARGEGFIAPRIAGQLIRRVREPDAIEPGAAELTARELHGVARPRRRQSSHRAGVAPEPAHGQEPRVEYLRQARWRIESRPQSALFERAWCETPRLRRV